MKIKLEPTNTIIAKLGLENKGPVHQWFTNTCALHMDKYVPYRNGPLAKTVVVDGHVNPKNVTEDTITYAQEYAMYVYKGLSRSGNPLHYTDVPHDKARPYWDVKMWNSDKEKIEQEVENYIKWRSTKNANR